MQCVEPSWQNNREGYPVQVRCRKCWKCRDRRIEDYVGRALLEAETSSQVVVLTLTYREGEMGAGVLLYNDVQLSLKRIRRAGYSVRHLTVGEYGSSEGRAHWHMVLFVQSDGRQFEIVQPAQALPSVLGATRLEDLVPTKALVARQTTGKKLRRFAWQFWPHGLVECDPETSEAALRYPLKYVFKDEAKEQSVSMMRCSLRPALGHNWLMAWADDHVKQGLPLRSPLYSIPGVKDAKGRHKKFCVQGVSMINVANRYRDQWRKLRGSQPPFSEWLEEREDYEVRDEQERDALRNLSKQLHNKSQFFNLGVLPERVTYDTGCTSGVGRVLKTADGEIFYYRHGTEGEITWLARVPTNAGLLHVKQALRGVPPPTENLARWARGGS